MMNLYNIDCTEVDPADVAAACTGMITDPPYSRHVHSSAVSQSVKGGYRHRDFGFGHLTPALRRWLGRVAAALPRWSIMYSDVEHSTYLRLSAQAAGARYVRTIPWVRWSMPQMTGTMPPQGFEHILCFHHRKTKLRWNGPGNLVALTDTVMRGADKHAAQKPLSQALTLVSYFSDPGDVVFDPMAGSGTVPLACRMLGREFVAFEADPRWFARAQTRLSEDLRERDLRSIKTWLDADDESAGTERSRERRARRRQDKLRVKQYIGE